MGLFLRVPLGYTLSVHVTDTAGRTDPGAVKSYAQISLQSLAE